MRRSLLARWSAAVATLAAALLTVTSAAPAGAITHGDLDGDGHPAVGLMVAKDADGNPLWLCSGTLPLHGRPGGLGRDLVRFGPHRRRGDRLPGQR